ncbi:enhancer of split m7 protein-like [Anthonomus grandis grandis]|uniref:enhancer of split m7 protein-like n=1 Tax=Anthonomus grandis grandis TaxID=2921223 RepID=UPI0021661587|nr:enhancer of split m7 protein-like [Anthonomus grandis grandis]
MSSVGLYQHYPAQQQQQAFEPKPMSKTMQYRKVMKPLLERKRRARINRCLDELKDLMVSALAMEEENVTKLEKADILEITVAHLQKLKRQKQLTSSPVVEADRFRAGYTSCAKEVSKVLASTPGVDIHLGTKLMTHLGYQLNDMDSCGSQQTPLVVKVGPSSASSEESYHHGHYQMPMTPPSSRGSPSPLNISCESSEKVWRPW